MTGPMDSATLAQVRAARPDVSTWLSANAGSGKTRVLTDRVALLLLGGAAPQGILCLTYTKAAAGEMQNRLFKRLGEWAMLEDEALLAQLHRLSESDTTTVDDLPKARRLFARAIETPGGLKIQTIHSFCASLLRRFPVEAQISPGFREMDDRMGAQVQARVLADVAKDQPDVFDAFQRVIGAQDALDFAQAIAAEREAFWPEASKEDIAKTLGIEPDLCAEDVRRLPATYLKPDFLAAMAEALLLPKNRGHEAELLQAYAKAPSDVAAFEAMARTVLTATGTLRTRYLTVAMRKALGPMEHQVEAFALAVFEASKQILALRALEKSLALNQFGRAFLDRYEAEKTRLNVLDFEDLLLRTRALLSDPGVADWVLYRLDGGIEHVLVDEAQDTSPLQWKNIDLLTRELTAGDGQHAAGERTIFVVGDKKQSIYSFQGADPEQFDQMQADFDERLARVDVSLQSAQLAHSFRSAPVILRAVDATFAEGTLAGVPSDLSHIAFHDSMPGRVDLWPAIPKTANEEDQAWDDPVDIVSNRHHSVLLAEQIAAEIERMMLEEVLWNREDSTFVARRISAGDFLILVQRRSLLFHEIIRACKARGLPLAGADRLKIGGELAVKDLTALLAFLATPEDSLSLAAVLRSPLFSWTEEQLYTIAAGRKEDFLWSALRNRAEEFPQTVDTLQTLLGKVDFLRPYDLLSYILVSCKGRVNLTARLGAEAEEGIDALLSQALAYETAEVPSLTGFLAWLEADESEVRRQVDASSDQIRVMTVHGSKGLEAPIVIVPDAGKRRENLRESILIQGNVALWKPAKAELPVAMEATVEASLAKIKEERARLLYVAMTRAEQWLIVCAAGDLGEQDQSWHGHVQTGLTAAGAQAHLFAEGKGLRLEHWPETPFPEPKDTETVERVVTVPDTLGQAVAAPVAPPGPISPSDLGGAKVLAGDHEGDELAMERGTLLHRLLEILPACSPDTWDAVAKSEGGDFPGLDSVLATARGIITAPELAHLFQQGTLAEVPITGQLFGKPCIGSIDRLIIEDDRILAIDYKSNALVPDRAEDTPEGLLRQMGAYADLLSNVFPDQRIETAILWTNTASLMVLPHALVSAALQRASTLDPAAPNT